jgi:hypothetical protein
MTSVFAVDGYCERGTDLSHAAVRKPAKAINQHRDRHAFNRVQIDCGASRDGIVEGFQEHFACQASDSGCARCDQRPA